MSSLVIDDLVSIKKNHIVFDRNKYFRRSAHKMELCNYGRKSDSVLTANYMQITGKMAKQHLESVPIETIGPFKVDWTDISQKDLKLDVAPKFFGFDTEIALEFDKTLAEQMQFELMCFYINERPLRICLNDKANVVRNEMAAEGKDARIVSSILVAMDIKLAEHFSTHSAASLTASKMSEKILGITAGTGRVGSKTIQITPGVALGYGLHKVKGWRKSKTEIKQLEDDWVSFG